MLLYLRVVASIHGLHLLLVLLLSGNIDTQAKTKALRIGVLRLHGIDAGGRTCVALEQAEDSVVPHLEVGLDDLANQRWVSCRQAVHSLSHV